MSFRSKERWSSCLGPQRLRPEPVLSDVKAHTEEFYQKTGMKKGTVLIVQQYRFYIDGSEEVAAGSQQNQRKRTWWVRPTHLCRLNCGGSYIILNSIIPVLREHRKMPSDAKEALCEARVKGRKTVWSSTPQKIQRDTAPRICWGTQEHEEWLVDWCQHNWRCRCFRQNQPQLIAIQAPTPLDWEWVDGWGGGQEMDRYFLIGYR